MYKQVVIDGIETNYNIYDDGSCFNAKTNKFLAGSVKNTGYRMYNLTINGEKKYYSAHRLVAIHFIPNPDNLPVVNHKDGNKLNNSVTNLEWVTQSENRQHACDNIPQAKKQRIVKYSEDLKDEIWKQILDTHYYVSNFGRIKNLKTNNLLAGSVNKAGYVRCTLRINNISKSYLVHKLVYFSFNDVEEIKGYVINHKDGNKENNSLSNLEYITNAENVLHGKYELGSKKAVKRCCQMDNQSNILRQYNSLTQAAKEISGSVSGISLAIKNNTIYKGYYWN